MNMRKSSYLVFAIGILYLIIAIYFSSRMPDRMGILWDLDGEGFAYLPKFWAIFLIPTISLTTIYLLFFILLPGSNSLSKTIKHFEVYYNAVVLTSYLLLLSSFISIILWNIGINTELLLILIFISIICMIVYYIVIVRFDLSNILCKIEPIDEPCISCDSNHDYLNFQSEKPISNVDQDELNRSDFIGPLTDRIINFNNRDCLVIGIHGPWGCGKSSFLSLLSNELKTKNESLIVVNFNPWNYTSIDQLISMFFMELKSAIGASSRSDDVIKIGECLELLGDILSPIQILPGAGKVPASIQRLGIGIKKVKQTSLFELKKELNDLLLGYNKKLLILIDDIDRLDEERMRLMFRLISLNADFPNTIYVLAFDKTIVGKALDTIYGLPGRAYIEKIIQVPFDLPMADPTIIKNKFLSNLYIIMPELKQESNQDRLIKLYESGFKSFFKTIRDTNQYLNALRLTYPIVKDEINPVDFMLLEAIRVFTPEVYMAVSAKKQLLIPNPMYEVLQDRQESNEKK